MDTELLCASFPSETGTTVLPTFQRVIIRIKRENDYLMSPETSYSTNGQLILLLVLYILLNILAYYILKTDKNALSLGEIQRNFVTASTFNILLTNICTR